MLDTVILIPYRNREDHLEYYLKNSWVLLKKEMPNTKLVIIEQEQGKIFNRGKLLNVGFKEYMDKTNYFITQDVDVNPLDCAIKLYKLSPDKEIVGLYSSPCITLGGLIKISNDFIKKINGFPNNYWGWGTEDKALYNRAKFFGLYVKYNIFSKTKEASDNFTIFNDKDDRIHENLQEKTDFEYTLFNKLNNDEKYKHIMDSGLNNIDYTILEIKQLEENVELIKVSI